MKSYIQKVKTNRIAESNEAHKRHGSSAGPAKKLGTGVNIARHTATHVKQMMSKGMKRY